MRPPLPRLTSMILLCTLLSAFASLFRSTHLMCYQVFSSPLIFGLHTLCAFCVPRLLRYAQVVCVLVVNAVFLNLRLANLWSFSVEAPPYGHTSTAMHDMSVSGSGHTGKQIDSFDAVIRMQESPSHKRFRMQLTLHATGGTPHGAWRLVLAMFVSSVKTRRARSGHCRDARVYGHTTTAMHDNE